MSNLANVRPWGTILMGKNIRCDGPGNTDTYDRIYTCYSHIHEDHIEGFKESISMCEEIIFTKETKDLLVALKGPTSLSIRHENFVELEFNKPHQIKDEMITLIPSGHILGGAQVLVESDGMRILYSSDFNMPGAEIVKDVDVLILDSTHGEPKFDDNESKDEKMKKLVSLVKEETDELKPVIIHASRGKLQLLMHLLRNEIRSNIPFVTTDTESRLAKVYAKYDMPAEELMIDDSDDFLKLIKKEEPYVRFALPRGLDIPCEMQMVRSIRVGTMPEYAVLSTNMFQVNLTDHASFSGIMDYVKAIHPKKVITDNSGRTRGITAAKLAEEIKTRLGIDAIYQPTKIPAPQTI